LGTKISRASVGQALNQNADTVGSINHALCAVVIEEVIAATPQDVECIGIRGVTGQVIGNLLAHVIDGDGEIATTEGKRIIDDGTVLCAVLGSGAAKCIIGPSRL
jgi:hypothetical protein